MFHDSTRKYQQDFYQAEHDAQPAAVRKKTMMLTNKEREQVRDDQRRNSDHFRKTLRKQNVKRVTDKLAEGMRAGKLAPSGHPDSVISV